MNLRAVGWLLGCVILVVAGFLLVPAGIAQAYGEHEHVLTFLYSALASASVGLALVALNRGSTVTAEGRPDYYRREGLAVVGLAWIVAGMAGALPYLFGGILGSPVDAMFETVSGFTTTGSTVMSSTQIEQLPRSIGFWRSFTHWLGGFGIVMVFVILFPTGGRSLFRSEIPGVSREAGMQRVRDSALGLARIYVGMSVVEATLLWLLGLDWYDAAVHTFGTIATGGFSTHSLSVAAFGSWKIELVIVVFMFACGVNFALYDLLLRTGPRFAWPRMLRSTELRTYFGAMVVSTLGIAAILWFWGGDGAASALDGSAIDYSDPARALRDSLFQVVSIQTSTGYATADFEVWPQACRVWLMILAVIGACAGSTGGGIKVVRILVAAKAALLGVRRFIRPRAVYSVRIDDQPLDEAVVASITGYVALWVIVFVGATMCLAAYGIDSETAATAVLATLNNIGPGLFGVGPSQHFGEMPELVKVLLTLCMILGRLEFYAVVALLVPSFWRR
jgi:trk system potassium uptake protein TrkH